MLRLNERVRKRNVKEKRKTDTIYRALLDSHSKVCASAEGAGAAGRENARLGCSDRQPRFCFVERRS